MIWFLDYKATHIVSQFTAAFSIVAYKFRPTFSNYSTNFRI
jgi:hypothetical protein